MLIPMTKEQIKHMVDRFLGWKLPENFNPDAGISFKAAFNEHTAHPMKHEPTGTNLFDATQADAMVRYMIEELASTNADTAALLVQVSAAIDSDDIAEMKMVLCLVEAALMPECVARPVGRAYTSDEMRSGVAAASAAR